MSVSCACDLSHPWPLFRGLSHPLPFPLASPPTCYGFLPSSVLSSFKHTCIAVPTLYSTLRDVCCLVICTVGNPPSIVNTRSLVSGYLWSSCMLTLLSRIALSPELLSRYLRHSKVHDLVSVLHVRTSLSLASLSSPASHAFGPLAQLLLHSPCLHLTAISWHLICPVSIAAIFTPKWLSLLGGSPHLLLPLALYSTVATPVFTVFQGIALLPWMFLKSLARVFPGHLPLSGLAPGPLGSRNSLWQPDNCSLSSLLGAGL